MNRKFLSIPNKTQTVQVLWSELWVERERQNELWASHGNGLMSTLFVAQSIIVTIIFCNPIIETSQGGAEIKAMGNNIIYVFVDTKEQRKFAFLERCFWPLASDQPFLKSVYLQFSRWSYFCFYVIFNILFFPIRNLGSHKLEYGEYQMIFIFPRRQSSHISQRQFGSTSVTSHSTP